MPKRPPRFVTASSLFDGHDASINIIRRLLQAGGAEVIHLGHNRSVHEIVMAAIEENVHGICVSSYQGGHNEFFRYILTRLRELHCDQIRVFGGGGGTITPDEIESLHRDGVTRIYTPEDGQKLGLDGIIADMLQHCEFDPPELPLSEITREDHRNPRAIGRALSTIERLSTSELSSESVKIPVVGITGTGGAGKSSLTDEILLRFVADFPEISIGVLSIDPTKRKTGGALLGDRIRMNSIPHPRVFMRSLASRGARGGLVPYLKDAMRLMEQAGFDLLFIESSGIGQGDSAMADIPGLSLYVMTSEYGAATQLEKIDMLDFATAVVINKFERLGSEDAHRDVSKQFRRSRKLSPQSEVPVFGTIASQFNDPGVNAVARFLARTLIDRYSLPWRYEPLERPEQQTSTKENSIVPPAKIRYLSEIADTVRDYSRRTESAIETVRSIEALERARSLLPQESSAHAALSAKERELKAELSAEYSAELSAWDERSRHYREPEFRYRVRDREQVVPTLTHSLSGLPISRVALPEFRSRADLTRFLAYENLPGHFPFTAGIYPFKRSDEEPRRQFAGEGTPARTNERFHFLSKNDTAKRLSTAFDSVTLYGEDPDERPDIYGKVGESGVSICTLDDMKILYRGFDLCHPSTSVSMTINGPAPMILAMFFNTAIDQQVDRFESEQGRPPTVEERKRIASHVLKQVRGTVQADILKEDQAQNTCIFSIDFALKLMGDIQEYFIAHQIRNFYSVSISGYHIAEAGANPISQLAFTLANGFTYVEYYLSRGMPIDEFAPNLSFFFSNGLDPEYSVIGRVARRIWAIAMRDRYGANERSQKLKYHVQTSGRSLHAQEVSFNDIRTTLQALLAISDNCNSLHTNAYDEAITTPTAESVRRAMAIQMIIQRELGLTKNENPYQGSFFIEQLTAEVERAVLAEFDRLTARGGVLGAMEFQYQRNQIQEESLLYERKKDQGELSIIGVNTFLDPDSAQAVRVKQLTRATRAEKEHQRAALAQFKERHRDHSKAALNRLRATALAGGNIFAELMETVRVCSLGEISKLLYGIGGKYRRNL